MFGTSVNPSQSHDFFAFDSAGKVWNGTGFIVINEADFVTYRIPATPQGFGRFYAATPANTATFQLRVRADTLVLSTLVYEADVMQLDAIAANLNRLMALGRDNSVLDNASYDGSRMTGATLYVYDSRAHAAAHDKTTGLLYRYTITQSYNSSGVRQQTRMLREL